MRPILANSLDESLASIAVEEDHVDVRGACVLLGPQAMHPVDHAHRLTMNEYRG
jgi:hypothetical protein